MARKTATSYAERHWQLNWSLRSTLAVGVGAMMALASAYASTLSVDRQHRALRAELAAADQVQLLADYTAFIAQETANVRAAANAPRALAQPAYLSTAFGQSDVLNDLVEYDFSELKVARIDAQERVCLAQAIYFEARSEPRIGQLAVADVVLNRVKSSVYPSTICEVVFQGSERVTGCQFSFTCDGSMDGVSLTSRNRKWRESQDLAGSIMAGLHIPVSREATHYHADYIDDPVWAERLSPTAKIGTHKFYRFNNRKLTYAAPVGM